MQFESTRRQTKIMQFGHKHAHGHIKGRWYIYWRAYENTNMRYLISTRKGNIFEQPAPGAILIKRATPAVPGYQNLEKYLETFAFLEDQTERQFAQICLVGLSSHKIV